MFPHSLHSNPTQNKLFWQCLGPIILQTRVGGIFNDLSFQEMGMRFSLIRQLDFQRRVPDKNR